MSQYWMPEGKHSCSIITPVPWFQKTQDKAELVQAKLEKPVPYLMGDDNDNIIITYWWWC